MRVVKLYGELGKKYGKFHRFLVSSPGEALRALCANFPGFEKDMITAGDRGIGFRVFNGENELDDESQVTEIGSGHIKIVPVIIGANATTRILVGTVLIAAGLTMSAFAVPGGNFLIAAGVSLTLGGVIELLSPVPKIKEPDERPENKPSYLFNGPVNTTAQGHPVPVGYGRVRVGGGVISAGIIIDQIMGGKTRVFKGKKSVDLYTFDNKTFSGQIPANVFLKELISYTPRDPNNEYSFDYWLYRFHYNDYAMENYSG